MSDEKEEEGVREEIPTTTITEEKRKRKYHYQHEL